MFACGITQEIGVGFGRADIMRKVSPEGEASCERRYHRVIMSLPLPRERINVVRLFFRGIFYAEKYKNTLSCTEIYRLCYQKL